MVGSLQLREGLEVYSREHPKWRAALRERMAVAGRADLEEAATGGRTHLPDIAAGWSEAEGCSPWLEERLGMIAARLRVCDGRSIFKRLKVVAKRIGRPRKRGGTARCPYSET